jgi:peptide/nickel transport system substrate-binding protein
MRRNPRATPLLAIGAILAACAPAGPAASQPIPASAAPQPTAVASPPPAAIDGGTVTIRLGGDWGNPIDGGHTVSSTQGIMLSEAMYSTLVHMDRATGEVVPYLASSWEQAPDSVTFTLRDDVTCSDGTPITPQVVFDSFSRLISPELESRWLDTLFGAGPYTISKDDAAGTFTFGLPAPNVRLLFGLADARAAVICPAGLAPDADFAAASYGSGPFVFESSVQGDEYVMVRREGWAWGPNGATSDDAGFPDRLVFKVITEDTTASNLLLTGGLDLAPVSGPDVARMAADPSLDHIVTGAAAPYLLALNHEESRPTATEAVRRAVITALDPKAWAAAAGEPDAPLSTNIQAMPGGYCYTDLASILPTPSIDAARQVLLDDGYEAASDGKLTKDGAPLTVRVLGTGFTGSGVEYIADALQRVGMTVDLVNTDYATFAQAYGRADYDVVVGLHGASDTAGTASRTPLFMVGTPVSEGGNNRLNRVDPALEAIVDRAYGASSQEDACAAWEEFNRYVIENAVARPWSSAVTHWFSKEGAFSYIPTGAPLVAMTIRRTQ